MKKAIIIHGYNNKSEFLDETRPSASNDHWIPWLQRKLLLHGIETQTPEMPGFYEPKYEMWKDMLDRLNPDENTILVGHSCGGGFLIRWLSESNKKVGKVVLVAPWIDPDKSIDPDFFNFNIDQNIVLKTSGIIIVYSTDDDPDIIETIKVLKKELKSVDFREFNDKGHFVLSSLGKEEFPELLSLILK